jgi:hypothetical protein
MEAEPLAVDVDRIMEDVRDRAARRRGLDPQPRATDLYLLRRHADVYHVALRARRPVVGPLVVALRRAVRRVLAPFLGAQVAYNLAGLRVLESLDDEAAALVRREAALRATVAMQAEALAALRRDVDALVRRERELRAAIGARG